jgi:hypothetical protein
MGVDFNDHQTARRWITVRVTGRQPYAMISKSAQPVAPVDAFVMRLREEKLKTDFMCCR